MSDNSVSPVPQANAGKRKPGSRAPRGMWKRMRKSLLDSGPVRLALVHLLAGATKFVHFTNRAASGTHDPRVEMARHRPAIFALWHGQHLLGPTVNPPGYRLVAMFSRSADAELNALTAEKLGFTVVRGSGGREGSSHADKGGARALIMLKRSLDAGDNVAMIADIPHGTPREAGLGIVTLAKISGRPIVPVAIATSRRRVLEKSWDKTTINLPFGRRSVIYGEPISVASASGPEEMEERRRAVTAALDDATARAYELVDGGR